jgi:hypothetical protein
MPEQDISGACLMEKNMPKFIKCQECLPVNREIDYSGLAEKETFDF